MTGRRGILVAWCASLLVVAFGLHALGDGALATPPLDPMRAGAWLAASDPLIATFAVLRVLVLAVCWYLLLVTVAGIVTRWLRADHLAVVLDHLTVPLVRRLVQQAAGVSLATVLVAAPTSALAAPPLTAAGAGPVAASQLMPVELLPAIRGPVTGAPRSGEGLVLPWEMVAGGADVAVTERDPVPEHAASPAPATPPADAGAIHLVRSGDSLWRIASEHLEATLGRDPSDGEVAPFWQRLIEGNRDRLVDPTDPDLILPGQELRIPPVVAP